MIINLKFFIFFELCSVLQVLGIKVLTKSPPYYFGKSESCESVSYGTKTCAKLQNCLYYQVSLNYANYGCSICEEGYELQEDNQSAGYCIPLTQSSVKNCIANSKSILYGNGDSVCYQCKYNYVLSYDLKSCYYRTEKCPDIENCISFGEKSQSDRSAVCTRCSPGYTLSEDRIKCLNGCPIENCDTCIYINNVIQCIYCNDTTIGRYYPLSMTYDECMTCNTWRCKLMSNKVQECCLKNKL